MTNETLAELINKLRKELGTIVETSQMMNGALNDLPHSEGGYVIINLDSNQEEYICHSPRGFLANYRPSDGKLYEIAIKEINKGKN